MDLRGNAMTGQLGEFMCPLTQLSSLFFDRPLCYAYCLSDSILSYGTSFDPNPIRCQSPEDLTMCALLETTDLSDYINVTIAQVPTCSPANYTACESTNLTSTHRLLTSIDVEASFFVPDALSLNIYFNSFTDFDPDVLVFCDSPSCDLVYLNFSGKSARVLPGVQKLLRFSVINSDHFYMQYKSSGCGVLSDIQVNCWGFTLYIDSFIPLNLNGNWRCTAPPSPQVALIPESSPYWRTSIVPYSRSYAGNFNNWTGVNAVSNVIRGLDLSGIGLFGHLPSNIGNLKSLRFLSFFDNHLTGHLPRTLVDLTQLTQLSLSINAFNGTLNGRALGDLPNLQILGLGSNAFTGPLPSEIVVDRTNTAAQVISHSVDLSSNHFTGQLPASLCSINYTTLDVSGNELGCYASCWSSRIAAREVLVGGLKECVPTLPPTSAPSNAPAIIINNSTILVLSLCIGLGIPSICIVLGCFIYCCYWKNRKNKARKAVWRTLPPHKAIVKKRVIEDVLKVTLLFSLLLVSCR